MADPQGIPTLHVQGKGKLRGETEMEWPRRQIMYLSTEQSREEYTSRDGQVGEGHKRILYRGYQNWEVTHDLTKVNFKAVLEAGGTKAQWVKV